jgi:DNA-binding GntR family transcriptional regulator
MRKSYGIIAILVPESSTFAQIRRIILNHPAQLAVRIRADIIAGVYPFGARLPVNELCRRYQTSHMPIREALRLLSGEGIVISEPNRGARVRSVDESFVDELLNMRAVMEAHLARRAAERAKASDVAQLVAIEERLERHVEEKDYDQALAANRDFHQHIYVLADSREAAENIGRAWYLLAMLWQRFGYGEDRFSAVISDHQHLITAFAANDAQAAEMLMAAHVIKSKHVLIRQMHAQSALPTPTLP